MSQYPVDTDSNLVEAVNYLLSGPVSLGQNFEGMYLEGALRPDNQDLPAYATYVTGNLGNDQTVGGIKVDPATVNRYVDYLSVQDTTYPALSSIPGGWNITSITAINDSIIEIVYTPVTMTNYTEYPFVNNQLVTISNSTPSAFNGVYTVVNYYEPEIGVPGTTVQLLAHTPTAWPSYTAGAVATLNNDFTDYQTQNIPTPAQAFVTVTGPTDRVFVTCQNSMELFYYVKFVDILAYQPVIYLNINRYRPVATTNLPDNATGGAIFNQSAARIYNGYVWQLDKEIVSRPWELQDWSSLGTHVSRDNFGNMLFSNIIDNPGIGYWWYVFEIHMASERDVSPSTGAILPIGLRTQGTLTFTAQVIKQ